MADLFGTPDFRQMREDKFLSELPPLPNPSITPSTLGGLPQQTPQALQVPTQFGGAPQPAPAPTNIFNPAQPAPAQIPNRPAPRAGIPNQFSQSPELQTLPTPGGGQVGLPADRAAAIQAGVEQQNNRAEFEAAGLPTARESEQAGNVAELKARMDIRRKLEVMREGGATDKEIEAIGKEIGTGEGRSAVDMSRRLGARMKAKQESQAGMSTKQTRAREVTDKNARFKTLEDGTEVPINDAGVAQEAFGWLDSTGTDPEGKSMRDYLTASELKSFERDAASMGNKKGTSSGKRNLKNIQRKAEQKQVRDFERKEAKRVVDALTMAAKKAQTAEDNARISAVKASLSEINDRLKDKNSKTRPSKEEKAALIEQRNGFINSLTTLASAPATPQPTDAGGFVIGKEYTDGDGNVATYRGEGNWEPK